MRHAAAEPAGEGGDRNRGLTERGRKQAEEAGRALRGRRETFQRILVSPYLRARETARIVAAQFDPALPVQLTEGIAAGASPQQFLDAASHDVELLVGHMPDLAALVYQVTGESMGFMPSTLCCLETGSPGKIVWVRHPEAG